jgi:hypothetical protein
MLTFIFLGSQRHALAVPGAETTACAPIPDCPDIYGNERDGSGFGSVVHVAIGAGSVWLEEPSDWIL